MDIIKINLLKRKNDNINQKLKELQKLVRYEKT